MLAQEDPALSEAGMDMTDFEIRWREISPRLRTRLRSRGTPRWLADDVVQETGLRLFRMWDRVDHNGAVWGLAITIANNLLWDERNRRARGEVIGDVPERPAPHDAEAIGLARLELSQAHRLMARLSPRHRSVLLAEIGEAEVPSAITPDALKMTRLRARKRLGALMQRPASFGMLCLVSVRELARRSSDSLRRNGITPELQAATSATAGFVVAVALVTTTLSVPAEATPGDNRDPVGPTITTLAAEPAVLISAEGTMALPVPRAVGAEAGRSKVVAAPDPYNVTFGGEDDPARAGAGLGVEPHEDEFEPSAPECEQGMDAEDAEVHAGCSVETPAGTVSGGGEVDVNP